MFDRKDLMQRPGSLLRRANQAGSAVFAQVYGDLDLTQSQFGILFVLHFSGACDQTKLASELGLDKSNTGFVLSNLLERGLIQRERSSVDRRRFEIRITNEGSRLFTAAERRSMTYRHRLLAGLSHTESQEFMRLLTKFVRAQTDRGQS